MKVGERTWCHRSLTPVSVRYVTQAASEPLELGQMVMLLAPRRGSSPPFISGSSNLSAPLTTVCSAAFSLFIPLLTTTPLALPPLPPALPARCAHVLVLRCQIESHQASSLLLIFRDKLFAAFFFSLHSWR